MKKRLYIVFICSLLTIGNCFGQRITWQKEYINPNLHDEEAYDVCQADGDNYYLAGTAASNSNAYFYIIKVDNYGDTIWSRTIGYGWVHAVTTAGDGGCVLTGDREGAFAVKLNANGDTIWNRSYNGGRGFDIIRTLDNGYLICGDVTSGFDFKGYVCKADSLGNMQWQREYFDGYTVYFHSVANAEDSSGYIIAGTKDSSNGQIRGYLLKIDNFGTEVWETTFVIGINTYLESIAPKINGYMVCGSTTVYPHYDSVRVFVAKTDLFGNMKESIIFPSPFRQSISRIISANYNKFYISHWTKTAQTNIIGSTILSLDTNFNIIKQVTILPSVNHLGLYSMSKTWNSTDIIGCGISNRNEFGSADYYAIRIDSALNLPPPIRIEKLSHKVPFHSEIINNYPNPFNAETKIVVNIAKKSLISLKIYDTNGKEVLAINSVLSSGVYIIPFNGQNLSSGLYSCVLIIDGTRKDTRKMVLIK